MEIPLKEINGPPIKVSGMADGKNIRVTISKRKKIKIVVMLWATSDHITNDKSMSRMQLKRGYD